jgi:hypothetical protein
MKNKRRLILLYLSKISLLSPKISNIFLKKLLPFVETKMNGRRQEKKIKKNKKADKKKTNKNKSLCTEMQKLKEETGIQLKDTSVNCNSVTVT